MSDERAPGLGRRRDFSPRLGLGWLREQAISEESLMELWNLYDEVLVRANLPRVNEGEVIVRCHDRARLSQLNEYLGEHKLMAEDSSVTDLRVLYHPHRQLDINFYTSKDASTLVFMQINRWQDRLRLYLRTEGDKEAKSGDGYVLGLKALEVLTQLPSARQMERVGMDFVELVRGHRGGRSLLQARGVFYSGDGGVEELRQLEQVLGEEGLMPAGLRLKLCEMLAVEDGAREVGVGNVELLGLVGFRFGGGKRGSAAKHELMLVRNHRGGSIIGRPKLTMTQVMRQQIKAEGLYNNWNQKLKCLNNGPEYLRVMETINQLLRSEV